MKAPEMVVAFTKIFFKPPIYAIVLFLLLLVSVSALVFSLYESLFFLFIAVFLALRVRDKKVVFLAAEIIIVANIAFLFLITHLFISIGSKSTLAQLIVYSVMFSLSYFIVSVSLDRGMIVSVVSCLPFIVKLASIIKEPVLAIFPFMVFLFYSFFLFVINIIFLNVVSATATGIFSSFVSYWYDNDKRRVEAELKKIGDAAEFNNRIVSFSLAAQKLHLVVPGIHYGPIGELGSADFPAQIEKQCSKIHSYAVLHSPSTHDMDIVARDEVASLVKSVVFHAEGNEGYHELKLRYASGTSNTSTCHIIEFGTCALVLFSNHPDTTEDIAADFGNALLNRANQVVNKPVVIDCHDSDTGKLIIVSGANQYGKDYSLSMERALASIQKKQFEQAQAGFVHWDSHKFSAEHVATGGASLIAFSTNDLLLLMIAIDSNSINHEFRDELEKAVTQEAQKLFGKKSTVIFCTSDTHETNMTRGIINPLEDHRAIVLLKKMLSEIKIQPAKVKYTEFPFSAKVISNSREFAGLFAASVAFLISIIIISFIVLIVANFLF